MWYDTAKRSSSGWWRTWPVGNTRATTRGGGGTAYAGHATLAKWIKQYEREDILPKRIKVDEIDEMKAARSWNGACRRAHGLLP
jgi:hypothetical protein